MDSRQQKYERKKMNKKRARASSDQLDKFDSLAWNSSLSQDDDTFSRFVGSNELEGGFLSLEEIDEVSYGLEIPKFDKETKATDEKFEEGEEKKGIKQKKKNKTRKQKNKDKKNIEAKESETKDSNGAVNEKFEVKEVEKKNKTKKSKNQKNPEKIAESAEKDDTEQDSIDETEYYAWNELRLHPMIMKSIYKLKFKEPTPIQKACIPAAAHQGKDVIGAAETGSGKTLAFGLPILHRLLQEREKDEKSSSKGYLRALIVTPTRELAAQVTDHLKQVCKDMDIKVVSIFGGMSSEKQERLLKLKPEIVVGTPGRLWELMSNGDNHLISLQFLSFFILDEADRMIETGHFRELQSIIDMLPVTNGLIEGQNLKNSENCVTVSNLQRKKRQTFVFSATIALSGDFRKKLKRGKNNNKSDEINSIEALSERAGMRENVAIVDLTNASIMANKLEESFLECKEEDKDAYLYYILSVHGQGRTIVFCTSIAALRHISSILRILGINVWTLHAQMQQRARLKAMDRFKGNDNGILIATDVAARGLDIPGVRTVVHYQLPHSAEVYVHRSGRTARAFSDGCSIALISPNDTSKFASLCKTFSKESFQRFPVELSYMPEVMKRLSLARQIDKITRKGSQDKAKKTWFEQNAESIGLDIEEIDSEDEKASECKLKKATSAQLNKLLQELKNLLSRPLQPKSLSNRFLAGAGVSPMLQLQIMELSRQKVGDVIDSGGNKRRKLMVIGQDCVEPLQALRSAGNEARTDLKVISEKHKSMVDLKRKRQQEKKRVKEQRRKQKKKMQMDKLNSS